MNTIYILLAVFAFAANSITIRAFQLKGSKCDYDINLFQALFCIVSAVSYFISGRFSFDLNFAQLLSAAMFGIFFAFAVLFSAACYVSGPMSLTSVIVNSSVIIPVLYSCITLNESITATQLVGFILLIVTFVLSAFQSNADAKNRVNFKWLIFVLIAFVSNGITAVIQKLYKISAPMSDGNAFMGMAYLFSAIVLLTSYFRQRSGHENKQKLVEIFSPVNIVLVLVAGLGSFIGNGTLMNLSTVVPAALLYPFLNGGICLAASVFSVFVFRERLTVKKAITILVGLSAVIILNF